VCYLLEDAGYHKGGGICTESLDPPSEKRNTRKKPCNPKEIATGTFRKAVKRTFRRECGRERKRRLIRLHLMGGYRETLFREILERGRKA